MKRPCSQYLIDQQDEKKTKRSDASSGLSPELSTASSTSMESTEKPLEDSGVKSESPSPEVITYRSVEASTVRTKDCTPTQLLASTELKDKCRRTPSTLPIDHSDKPADSQPTLSPFELVRSIFEVSGSRPVPADRETAIRMIRALQTATTTASSDKANPQLVGDPQLVSDLADLPTVPVDRVLVRPAIQLTPPPSVQTGQTAVATTSPEETSPNLQLVSDLADISIGAGDMVLARPARQLTPPPALRTGLIVGISRPDRSPYWVVQPWPSGGASMPLDEWKETNRP